MKPYYQEKGIEIWLGDCREILPSLEPVDLVLTDPPYGVGENYLSHDDTRENLLTISRQLFKEMRSHGEVLAITCGVVNMGTKWPSLPEANGFLEMAD